MSVNQITLDLDFFLSGRFPSNDQISALVMDVAQEVATKTKQEILDQAQLKLKTTYSRYDKALIIETSTNDVSLVLAYSRDWLVKALEEGMPAKDLKPQILASSKAKISISGQKYAVIPIGKSFRVVSENSDPRLWIHPGLKALNLTENAFKDGRVQDNFIGLLNQKLVHLFSIT